MITLEDVESERFPVFHKERFGSGRLLVLLVKKVCESENGWCVEKPILWRYQQMDGLL